MTPTCRPPSWLIKGHEQGQWTGQTQSLLSRRSKLHCAKTQLCTTSFITHHRMASPFSGTQRQLWGHTSLVGVAIPPRARPSDLTSTALARPSSSFLVGSLQSSRTQRPEILTLQGFGRHQVGRVSGLFGEITLLRFLSVTLLLSVCSKHREEQITLQEVKEFYERGEVKRVGSPWAGEAFLESVEFKPLLKQWEKTWVHRK